MNIRTLVVSSVLLLSGPADAQSLVEIAATARAARQPAVRTYRNADLRVWPAPVVKNYGPMPQPVFEPLGGRSYALAAPDPYWPFDGPRRDPVVAPWSMTTWLPREWRRGSPSGFRPRAAGLLDAAARRRPGTKENAVPGRQARR